MLVCGGAGGEARIYPESRRGAVTTPERTISRSQGHHRDWVDAIKGGPPASSNFKYGAKLTEITLLGLVALRTGQVIRWDSERIQAIGVPKAEVIIQGEYRSGWELT
jgi:hypothetical protein